MNPKTVFIHIGSDKAGSTALQSFAFGHAEWLARRGVHVVGSRNQHHGPILHGLRQDDTAVLDAAAAEIRAHPAERHLLTFEGFYHLDGKRLQTFLRAFDGLRVHVLYYVRRRSDRMRSGFAQNLKMGDPVQRERATQILFGTEFPRDSRYLSYATIVRRWQKALQAAGPHNRFELAVYERRSLIRGNLLADFLTRLGVLGADEPMDGPPFNDQPARVNPSLTPAAQYLMVLTQAFGLDDRRRRLVKDLLVEAEAPKGPRGSLVPDDLATFWDTRELAEDAGLAREFLNRDTLFLEDAQFAHRLPQGEEFIALIRRLHEARDRLQPDEPPAPTPRAGRRSNAGQD